MFLGASMMLISSSPSACTSASSHSCMACSDGSSCRLRPGSAKATLDTLASRIASAIKRQASLATLASKAPAGPRPKSISASMRSLVGATMRPFHRTAFHVACHHLARESAAKPPVCEPRRASEGSLIGEEWKHDEFAL